MITHRKRLEACLSKRLLDRPPVALWRHFPVDDQTPQSLAHATLVFQRTFDFDLVKVTPSSSYCLLDWGAKDEWRGASEGTREYLGRVIQNPEDWRRLQVLDPRKGRLADQLECLRLLVQEFEPATPVIQTIFSPLSQAKNLVGADNLIVHLRRYPEALHEGLRVITQSIIQFIEAARAVGISGIFYAVQHAQYGLLSEAEYNNFGRNYDLQALKPAQDLWLRLIHLHGMNVMFDLFNDYPINILNWHDRETTPSLSLAQARFTGTVCGGVSRTTLVLGNPDQVRSEALEAIQSTAGEGLIVSTGCVAPITAPYGNLLAVRQSVD